MNQLLELKNINKSFSGIQVLQNVGLTLCEGEVVCLVGENGAGKSTLIKILSGAERPDSGEIYISGEKYEGNTGGTEHRYRSQRICGGFITGSEAKSADSQGPSQKSKNYYHG
ncbi:MAG: sugar transporter ATP-binding protein [Clostridiales bacterium]|nr:sugar transporter ATP-binding protein [Clostridiales bacterium]